jgi:hypothetical protein
LDIVSFTRAPDDIQNSDKIRSRTFVKLGKQRVEKVFRRLITVN